jgi:hypothetical protein
VDNLPQKKARRHLKKKGSFTSSKNRIKRDRPVILSVIKKEKGLVNNAVKQPVNDSHAL